MAKFEYTEDMENAMVAKAANGINEELIESLCEEFGFPRRSVTAKLRKLGLEVPAKPKAQPVFSAEETEELRSFLTQNAGVYTAEEIAEAFADGKFNARQINGKVMSLELTKAVKPAEAKVAPKTYTPEQEAKIEAMVSAGAYIEEIAEAVGKTVPQVRGKLLSMKLSAPQKDKKETKTDAYEGIETLATTMTVAELAAHFGKTERGVKTVLSRRNLSAKDYEPKSAKE